MSEVGHYRSEMPGTDGGDQPQFILETPEPSRMEEMSPGIMLMGLILGVLTSSLLIGLLVWANLWIWGLIF